MSHFSFKVGINKHKTKVLFAQVDSDFADVLLSFLTLPLGKVVRILEKHYGEEAPVIGSLTTLYQSLSNLDTSQFWTDGCKQMLLDPRTSFSEECRKLKLDLNDASPVRYFVCDDCDCGYYRKLNISMYCDVARCECGMPIKREVPTRNATGSDDSDEGGVFTAKGATFIMSDELLILPNVAGPVTYNVSNILGYTDADCGEIKNVTFGYNEVVSLLKAFLLSETPLTDVILNNGRINFASPFDPITLSSPRVERKRATNSRKILLKLIFKKSTNEFLFAQAGEDFIDFLCSLLTIPLGRHASLPGGGTSVTALDSFYTSVMHFIEEEYFKSVCITARLAGIKLSHGYLSDYQILPLGEEEARKVYYYGRDHNSNKDFMSVSGNMGGPCIEIESFQFINGHGSFVKRPGVYMVNDDLSVTPLCMMSHHSKLNRLGVHDSDVTELEMPFGLDEALSVLKASLVSSSALSIGLNLNPPAMKQPKQEQEGNESSI